MELESINFLPTQKRLKKEQKEKVVLFSSVLNEHLEALEIAENQLKSLIEKIKELQNEIPQSNINQKNHILTSLSRIYRLGITWDEIKTAVEKG